ncbi:hypothetical protein [Pedobacter sp.]|uniref:hypothetical protein n=1 Tax=Pedobacter sp. TaxID=1411316 RepID=UPI00396C695C
MRPNAFVTSLLSNNVSLLSKVENCSPTYIEQVIEVQQEKREKLESLRKSLSWFASCYNGDGLFDHLKDITVEINQLTNDLSKAVVTPQPLSQMVHIYPTEAKKGLSLLINDLRLFFKVDNVITSDGIKSLVPMIISEYGSLSLEEVSICFNQAKKGAYGETYNRLDGPVILKWLRIYYADKVERIRLKQQNQHTQSKADIIYREIGQTNSDALNQAHAAVELEKVINKK